MAQFEDLLNDGRIAEGKFEALLQSNLIGFMRLGQEYWLPRWIHTKIRHINDRIEIDVLRHVPDYATPHAMVQIKHAKNSNKYPSVTIQQSSLKTSLYFASLDIPVLVAWLLEDGDFYGNWVQYIEYKEAATPRHLTNGSHTPYYLVSKNQLQIIDVFLRYL